MNIVATTADILELLVIDQKNLTWQDMVDHIATLAIEEDTRLGLSFRDSPAMSGSFDLVASWTSL